MEGQYWCKCLRSPPCPLRGRGASGRALRCPRRVGRRVTTAGFLLRHTPPPEGEAAQWKGIRSAVRIWVGQEIEALVEGP